jgi:hypothetical protein
LNLPPELLDGELVESGKVDFKPLRERIGILDSEVREVSNRLLSPGPGSLEADLDEIRVNITRSLRDLSGLLSQDVATARAWLRDHVRSITMTPVQGVDGKKTYRASGEWNLLGGTETRDSVGCGGWI